MARGKLSLSLINTTSDTLDTARITYGKDELDISFKRTIQIPQICPSDSPPDLGGFPIYHVKQHEHKLPNEIVSQGGLFIPVYQREAMWLSFKSKLPFAVEVFVDSINAVSSYNSAAEGGSQHYIVSPIQNRLDGCAYVDGNIEQFVARPTRRSSVPSTPTAAIKTSFTTMEFRIIPMREKDIQICFKSLERKIKLELDDDDRITKVGGFAIAFNTLEPSMYPGYPSRMYFEQTYGELVLQSYDTPQTMGIKSGATIELRTRTYEPLSRARSRSRNEKVRRPRSRVASPSIDIATLPKRGRKMNNTLILDPLQPEHWDRNNIMSFKMHLINAYRFTATTGLPLPPTSIESSTYTEYKYPWLETYDEPEEA